MHSSRILQHEFVLPALLLIGLTVLIGYYFGKNMKFLRLPSIIGFMVFGIVLGPSLLNVLSTQM